jgi:hypothetical protein
MTAMFGSSGTMPKVSRIDPSKSSQTETNSDSLRSRDRATACSGLGTSGRQATGMTWTPGIRWPAGQLASGVTGCRDHSSAAAPAAVGWNRR